MTEDQRIVYSFARNMDEEIRATLSTFRGRRLADLRTWRANEDDQLFATKKGISISVEDLPKLLAAVQALIDAENAAA